MTHSAASPADLLRVRRFGPLFLTQFLGAFNDNVFRNALVMLITYQAAVEAGWSHLLVPLAPGLFILPYFLFSATAGALADRCEKARLIRWVKLAEVGIMLLAAAGFVLGMPLFLMAVLFLMGTQSAFFGPLKYSILPAHLRPQELIAGNGLIQAGTFLAILLGLIAGERLIMQGGGDMSGSPSGPLWVGVALVGVALLGWASSFLIPPAPAASPELPVSFRPDAVWRDTQAMIDYARQDRRIFLAILGISWFWLVGSALLAQLPLFGAQVLGVRSTVVTLFLCVFSVGIGIGALLCQRLLHGQNTTRYVPLGALGMTVFLLDLVLASGGMPALAALPDAAVQEDQLRGIGAFLSTFTGWRMLLDLTLIAVCGGLYIVPLQALIQAESAPSHRSRVIAANNIINAAFMVAATGLIMLLLAVGVGVPGIFLVLAVLNLGVAVYVCALLPDALIKTLVRAVLRRLYRVEVHGLEHYRAAGPRVVIVANHTSYLDAVLLAAFLPDSVTFAVNTHVAQRWWVRAALHMVRGFPLDPTNPLAAKHLIAYLKQDQRVVIFPEGRITVTGALMKVYDGPAMIAEKAGAPLLPIRIDGALYTPFSRMRGKLRLRWFPPTSLTILPARCLDTEGTLAAHPVPSQKGHPHDHDHTP